MRRAVSFGGAAAAADDSRSTVLEYAVRFLPSIQDGAVIADRGFNQANLEAAVRKDAAAVRLCKWTETDPNDLALEFQDGSTKAIKVTKRATEMTADTVQSSEFQRVVVDSGIPDVSARRVVTKWKRNENGTLEGLEVVYDVGGGSSGDPLSFSLANSNAQPTVLSKSRLLLERY